MAASDISEAGPSMTIGPCITGGPPATNPAAATEPKATADTSWTRRPIPRPAPRPVQPPRLSPSQADGAVSRRPVESRKALQDNALGHPSTVRKCPPGYVSGSTPSHSESREGLARVRALVDEVGERDRVVDVVTGFRVERASAGDEPQLGACGAAVDQRGRKPILGKALDPVDDERGL